jgi:cytochrome c553
VTVGCGAAAARVRTRALVAAAMLAAAGAASAQAGAAPAPRGATSPQAGAASTSADTDRFATCAPCHGAGGVSTTADTPSLAGQHSFYAITQLFLFRAGRRANPLMTAMAKGMSDADLRAYSDLIATLPAAPPAAAGPADPARMARGAALAQRHRCNSCHGDDYAGEKQVPRLAGQREDYLAKTLAEFKAGTRVGYTSAMNETLAGVDAQELPDLAHYLAHVGARR